MKPPLYDFTLNPPGAEFSQKFHRATVKRSGSTSSLANDLREAYGNTDLKVLYVQDESTPLQRTLRTLSVKNNQEVDAIFQAHELSVVKDFVGSLGAQVLTANPLKGVSAMVTGAGYVPVDGDYNLEGELRGQFDSWGADARKNNVWLTYSFDNSEEMYSPSWLTKSAKHLKTSFMLPFNGRPDTVFDIRSRAMSLHKHFPVVKESLQSYLSFHPRKK